MPRQLLNASSNGTTTDWLVVGSSTSWEAVLNTSDDSSYLESSTLNDLSELNCGAGYQPIGGRIMAVSIHYRMRAVNASSGAQVDIILQRGGSSHLADTVALPSANWVDGTVRVREDWTTSARFTIDGVADLGAAVKLSTAPSSGSVRVSRLWLEVEYVYGPYLYDPYDGVLPDAITGPLNWNTLGTQPASITGNYLRIDDTSSTDTRLYAHQVSSPVKYSPDYITEIETRINLTNIGGPSSAGIYMISGYFEETAVPAVVCTRVGGVQYIGLSATFLDPADLNNFYDIAQFEFENKDLHFRIVIDRDDTVGSVGKVSVYLDYADDPILSAGFYSIGSTTVTTSGPTFGSTFQATGQVRADIDYFAFRSYRKRGDTFSSWKDWTFGDNQITVDSTDSGIVKPVELPPGVIAGQSQYACVLEMNDPADLCQTYQVFPLPEATPQTYKLDLDHKQDVSSGANIELLLQRFPDLYYWDDVGKVWSSTEQAIVAPIQTSRTRSPLVTNLSVPSLENILLITIRTVITAPLVGSVKGWIYKVYLARE